MNRMHAAATEGPDQVPAWNSQRTAPRAEEVVHASGRPLEERTLADMGPKLEHNFAHIRVHTDTDAAAAARDVGARAYTIGRHIVFAAGQYAPGTPAGDHLIAHELVHVLQQSPLRVHHGAPVVTPGGDRSEGEAEIAASLLTVSHASAPMVHPVTPLAGALGATMLQRQQRPFSEKRIEEVRSAYEENTEAAANDAGDRAACIVMLNVAVGRLLHMKTRPSRAREKSKRRVDMPRLTTSSVENAMGQLVRKGLAAKPVRIRFLDSRKRTAGTLAPQTMDGSVQATLLAHATGTGWYGFGLSIMNGYHSVLLLVDHTEDEPKIYWLDQFSTGVDDDVTDSLDQRLLDRTKSYWERFRSEHAVDPAHPSAKRRGQHSDTWARIWPLRGNIAE